MDTDQSLALEFSSIDNLIKHGFKTFVQAIKSCNALPSGSNHDFHNTNESFNKLLIADGGRILQLMNRILKSDEIPLSVLNRSNDERVEILVDANDQILENVADMIDEYSGIKKKPARIVEIETVSANLPINGSWNQISKAQIAFTSSIGMPKRNLLNKTVSLISAKNIIRPQTFFKDKIDNSNLYPWQPRITAKPNSIKPLSLYVEYTEFGQIYSHPYETELEKFAALTDTLTKRVPVKYDDINTTALIEINTEDGLACMLDELRNVREIAVDLEHHSYRTFMGITCLMQISIPGRDYLIDTLELRDKLWVLNEVFTKTSIVKIFHGADSDIQWLQRDLSLYVVNMFDTHQAAILLNYPRRSLACLITKFCQFAPNKLFQLADWRIRPLPEELKMYAREDTHYLIYIYHMMRNELIDAGNGESNLLEAAFDRSIQICLKRYNKNICTEDSHLKFYRNCKRFFDNRQLFALKLLFNWRDNIAREEDESVNYILPNHMMLQICESLPREMQGIFACCNPIPPLLRANALEIHNFILKARDQPLEKPILKEDNRAKGSTLQFNRINLDGPLYCPHDIIRVAEFSDLPTIFNKSNNISSDNKKTHLDIQKLHSVYSVFDTNENNYDDSEGNIMKNLKFLGPYERYKLVKSFVQAEAEKEQKKTLEISDKNDDPSVEERIAALQKECSAISPMRNNQKVTPKQKLNKKTARYKSILQQYPNTKRKRRSSFELDDIILNDRQSNDQLTSTIPNFNLGLSNNRRKRNAQELDDDGVSVHKNKKPRKGRRNKNANANNNAIAVGGKKNLSALEQNCVRNRQRHSNQQKGACEDFKPFDYGSIDFKRFGGVSSEKPPKQMKIKSQFKGRGQGKQNFRGRNANKSAPFFRNERK